MLKYIELKAKPKEFLCATGLTEEEFQSLLPGFEKRFLELPLTECDGVEITRIRAFICRNFQCA